jgi:hypothetical protein
MMLGSRHPRSGLAAIAIRPQHRHDEVRRGLVEHLRAVVAGAGHERLLEACLAQHLDGLGRRQHRPGVFAVMDVHVDNRARRVGDGVADTGCRQQCKCKQQSAHPW